MKQGHSKPPPPELTSGGGGFSGAEKPLEIPQTGAGTPRGPVRVTVPLSTAIQGLHHRPIIPIFPFHCKAEDGRLAVRPHGEMQGGVEGELGTAFYVSGGSPGVGSAPRPLGPPVGIRQGPGIFKEIFI